MGRTGLNRLITVCGLRFHRRKSPPNLSLVVYSWLIKMSLKWTTCKIPFGKVKMAIKVKNFGQSFFFSIIVLICLYFKDKRTTSRPKYLHTITKDFHISEIRWNLSTKLPIFIGKLLYLVNGLRFGVYYGLRFRLNRFKHSVKRFGRFGLDTLLNN